MHGHIDYFGTQALPGNYLIHTCGLCGTNKRFTLLYVLSDSTLIIITVFYTKGFSGLSSGENVSFDSWFQDVNDCSNVILPETPELVEMKARYLGGIKQ